MQKLELQTTVETAIEAHRPESLQSMMSIIERAAKDPSVDIDKMERLLGMAERMEARNSEKLFIDAFNQLQKRLPIIVAKTVIPNRGRYQKFEDIMEEIGPLLQEEGFTVSFSMDFKENRILETCHLSHRAGYTRSNTFAVRTARADSDTQADCKAATTAKRNALLNALNIVIRQDCINEEEDAGMEGDPNAKVTQAQADELERRVKETNSNLKAFLTTARASKFSDIPASEYDNLDALLRRKEQQGR